jgi:hypothetical protein
VVVSRPLSVRLALGGTSVVFGLVCTILAAEGASSRIVLLVGLAATGALTVRGLRISLCADRSEIVVRNYLRTYRLRWENVSGIGISVTTSLNTSFAAVTFRERGGRDVSAQATTSSGQEQRRVIRELATLRPDLPIQFSE